MDVITANYSNVIIVFGLFSIISLSLTIIIYLKLKKINLSNSDQFKFEIIELLSQKDKTLKEGIEDIRKEIREVSSDNRKESSQIFKNFQDSTQNILSQNGQNQFQKLDQLKSSFSDLSEKLIKNSNDFREDLTDKISNEIKKFEEELVKRFEIFGAHQNETNDQSKKFLLEIRSSIEKQLSSIREDNTKQLDEMRKTVDEKLQSTLEKRLTESFNQVSERLEEVHKGLGAMRSLADGVGDLKKVLSNVKTRGILGEYQLANILEQVLSPDQHEANVATKKGSRGIVEFAIKLPGKQDEDTVWLPIDSKFPLESWSRLQDAWENSDQIAVKKAQNELLKAVESFAKDIHSKYIDPPHTTNFAVMFLPVEGLYAEIMRNSETFEKLQRDYRITITGPTTLSALLSSLNMGFRTLAVQKRTSEVWKVLALLKNEFEDYTIAINKVSSQFNVASKTLETLQTTRTNKMKKKLLQVESLEDKESKIAQSEYEST